MNDKLYFAKIRPYAIIPLKRLEDGGYDIYANFPEEYIEIQPNEVKLIPTGIATAFSPRYVMLARERGSTGSLGMSLKAGVIDSGYRGEIFIAINNTNRKTIIIDKKVDKVQEYTDCIYYPYNKAIAQLILVENPVFDVEEISYEELKNIKSERGLGKLGSSGK